MQCTSSRIGDKPTNVDAVLPAVHDQTIHVSPGSIFHVDARVGGGRIGAHVYDDVDQGSRLGNLPVNSSCAGRS